MPWSLPLAMLLATGSCSPRSEPAPFAPGVVSTGREGAAAFSNDGTTVYFMRSVDDAWTLLESHRSRGRWSHPVTAPFSGRWHDLDPAMAPDGSYLIFVSNRPATGGQPIDLVHAGQRHAGAGMNLWRVDRRNDGWGEPVRLPDSVNTCSMTFAPSVAADGSVYFIGCQGPGEDLRLMRTTYRAGHYLAAEAVGLGDDGTTLRDPAIAPDGSFIVVSARQAKNEPYRLAVAFRGPHGWSTLTDLGDRINQGTHSTGAQLGPDGHTLYFYSDRPLAKGAAPGGDNLWKVAHCFP